MSNVQLYKVPCTYLMEREILSNCMQDNKSNPIPRETWTSNPFSCETSNCIPIHMKAEIFFKMHKILSNSIQKLKLFYQLYQILCESSNSIKFHSKPQILSHMKSQILSNSTWSFRFGQLLLKSV